MPFRFYDYERLSKSVQRLREERWGRQLSIPAFAKAEGAGTPGQKPPQDYPETLRIGESWSGYDRWIWLRADVEIPEDFTGDLWGRFDFGATNGGATRGFESLLYVNGDPWQAVDQNHQETPLTIPEDRKLRLEFRLWSGLTDQDAPHDVEHTLYSAAIAQLDENVDSLYYWLLNLLEAYQTLPEDSPDKPAVLNLAVKAWDLVDTSGDGREAFCSSCGDAVRFIEENFGSDEKKVNVTMVGHTHIDTAWLWRLCHTREKCARSFSTVNRLMDRYPEYLFMHTSPQQYDYIREDYPEIYQKIQRRVKEGRWEPNGGMWVECDCNLPSGESFVRQFLYGTRFFEQEFGAKSNCLWMPDVFGYSSALPQIMKQCGIDTFITTKMAWNDQNRMPYDTFYWKGIDGSQVVTHLITGEGTCSGGTASPRMTCSLWDSYNSKDLNTEVLGCIGFGDGGGGPNRDMLENIRRVGKIPGMPGLKMGRVDEYCDRLHQTMKENKRHAYVPVWDGELYLEFHRGTLTSQAYNKKMNRRMEFLLRNAEMFVALAYEQGKDVKEALAKLEEAWKIVLTQQFHDIIPGSSITSVYEDSHVLYGQAEELTRQAMESALGAKAGETEKANNFTVWNTANWDRTSVVELKGDFAGKHLALADGTVPVQNYTAEGGIAAQIPLASLGAAQISLKEGAIPHQEPFAAPMMNPETSQPVGITTALLSVKWDENGHIISIFDREAQRDLVPEGDHANVITLYEDRPREYDAWELEYSHQRKGWGIGKPEVTIRENSALRSVVEFAYTFKQSKLVQQMILYPHTKRIDFATWVDWNQRELVMKTAFSTNLRSSRARFDIQFGSMERPTTRNNSWEFARFESVGHKWADLSESGYGAALMSDSKYGYDIHEGLMQLTLLKGSNKPDQTADKGIHEFTYSFFPHTGEWYEAGVDQESWEINDAPVVTEAQESAVQIPFQGDLSGVTVDAFKVAEDGDAYILRFHEKEGRHQKISFSAEELSFRYWSECDLLEHEQGSKNQGKELDFQLRPFELKSIKFVV